MRDKTHVNVSGEENASLSTKGVIAPIPQVAIDVFCKTQELSSSARAATADRRMAKANVKIHMGGVGAALEVYQAGISPELIVVEVEGTPASILDQLGALAAVCSTGTKVIVIGHANDILLYRELVRRGVSDYLVGPIDVLTFVQAVSDAFNAPDASPIGRTIAVVGCKGGVGASTVAHNLAWAMSKKFGIGTVLVDLDVAFGTAGLNFNQDPSNSISDAVAARDNLDSAVVEGLLTKCRDNDNLNLLTSAAILDQACDMPENAIDRLVEILRGEAPIIIFDVPHMWSAWARRMLIMADEIIIVAVPDLANLRNAKNITETLRQLRPNDGTPKLLLNQVGLPKRPEIPQNDFVKPLDVEVMESIPFDAELFYTASNKGQMIAETQPSGKVAEKFLQTAAVIAGREETKKKRGKLLDTLRAKIKRKKS